MQELLSTINTLNIDDLVSQSKYQPLEESKFTEGLFLWLNDLRIHLGASLKELAKWIDMILPVNYRKKGLKLNEDTLSKCLNSSLNPDNQLMILNAPLSEKLFGISEEEEASKKEKNNSEEYLSVIEEIEQWSDNDDDNDSDDNETIDEILDDDDDEMTWKMFLKPLDMDKLFRGEPQKIPRDKFTNGLLYALYEVSKLVNGDSNLLLKWLKLVAPAKLTNQEYKIMLDAVEPLHEHISACKADLPNLDHPILLKPNSEKTKALTSKNSTEKIPALSSSSYSKRENCLKENEILNSKNNNENKKRKIDHSCENINKTESVGMAKITKILDDSNYKMVDEEMPIRKNGNFLTKSPNNVNNSSTRQEESNNHIKRYKNDHELGPRRKTARVEPQPSKSIDSDIICLEDGNDLNKVKNAIGSQIMIEKPIKIGNSSQNVIQEKQQIEVNPFQQMVSVQKNLKNIKLVTRSVLVPPMTNNIVTLPLIVSSNGNSNVIPTTLATSNIQTTLPSTSFTNSIVPSFISPTFSPNVVNLNQFYGTHSIMTKKGNQYKVINSNPASQHVINKTNLSNKVDELEKQLEQVKKQNNQLIEINQKLLDTKCVVVNNKDKGKKLTKPNKITSPKFIL